MDSSIWTIASDGVTKTVAKWGVAGLKRNQRVDSKPSELTFTMPGVAVDSAPIFAEYSSLSLYRDGVCWFSGVVTKIPRKGTTKEEDLSYVVSDAWWYLENLVFQQVWATVGTQSVANVGQSLNGNAISTGVVILELLYYALYAVMGIPYPATVGSNGVAAAPTPPTGVTPPFQIGLLTPSIFIPSFEARDKTCAEVFRMVLRYLPDVVKWFDFTTTPPTLNIDTRANLPAKTIKALTSNLDADGYVTSGFDPTARYDLQVPVVICKYASTNTVDGQVIPILVEDKYPPGMADNTVRGYVQTVDLLPSSSTFQKQDVTVKDMPRSTSDSIYDSWVRKNPLLRGLFGTVTYPSTYDVLGSLGGASPVTVDSIVDALNPSDPNNTTPQTGFSLNALTEELVAGTISTWMIADQGVLAAKVDKTITLNYSGTDPLTKALFNKDPANPNKLVFTITTVGTNASTQTYEELTNQVVGETAPIGFAEYFYNILSVLHQEGTLELTERECSGRLEAGCIFNTSDGTTEWQAMSALVLTVEEDIDKGTTKVQFGPTMMLGLQDLVELRRANSNRVIPNLTQRSSGNAASNAVIGTAYSPGSTTTLSLGGAGPTPPGNPYSGVDSSSGATPEVTVKVGVHNGKAPTFLGPFTVPSGVSYISVSVPFTYNSGNFVTPTSNTLNLSSSPTSASTITPSGTSGGSGTFNQDILKCTASVVGGKASVVIEPLVSGSQQFGVCLGAISGPWLV